MLLLCDDQEGHERNQIEDQKDDFEEPEKRIHDDVEGFSRNGKPFVLRTIQQVRCQYTHRNPEAQEGSIYDAAPHKEVS